MSFDIPALMKNAHNLDPLAGFPVEDKVRADGQAKISLTDMIDVPAFARSRREGFKGAYEIPMIGIGPGRRPGFERVEPNLFEIGAGKGEKLVITRPGQD